jgi:hypothetical protein
MKLKEYSLLAGALLAANNTFNQSKYYEDFDPDLFMTGEPREPTYFGFGIYIT